VAGTESPSVPRVRTWRWGYAAAVWAGLFAAAHLYWALGGSIGLAESAGAELARNRPTWFVVLGLYGVALLLAGGAVLGVALAHGPCGRGWWRLLPFLGAGVAGVLLLRAVVVEALLLSDADYGHGAISPAERFWTLVLWNPWFLIGGGTFALASVAARRNAHSTC
jgi:hypothetical protein